MQPAERDSIREQMAQLVRDYTDSVEEAKAALTAAFSLPQDKPGCKLLVYLAQRELGDAEDNLALARFQLARL